MRVNKGMHVRVWLLINTVLFAVFLLVYSCSGTPCEQLHGYTVYLLNVFFKLYLPVLFMNICLMKESNKNQQ